MRRRPRRPALDALLAGADIVIDTPGLPRRRGRSIPARAPDAVWVRVTPFGLDGPARGVAGVRPRRHGREREHVLHRRSRPRAGALHRADGLRARRAGGRVRRADRARERARRSASTSRCRRSCSSRTWRRRRASRRPGSAAARRGANIGRTREIWPTRDGFVSFGLRGGKARVPSLETAHRSSSATPTRLLATRLDRRSTRTPRPTRSCAAIEDRRRRVLRRGTRCRSCTTSRARPT